jgi:hypothetical protein
MPATDRKYQYYLLRIKTTPASDTAFALAHV